MVWKWSGDPPGGPKVVKRPSRSSGRGQEALPKVRKWLGVHPGDMEVVGKWSRVPPGDSEVVGRPSRRSGNGREALPGDKIWSADPP